MAFEFLGGKKHLSCFLVTIQTSEGTFYRIIDEKSFSVGRSLDCALSFPDPNISRVHIVVSCKKDQVWIIDQGSANGTFVNNQKITPSKLTQVQPEDVVKLGSSEISLKIDVFEKIFKADDLSKSILPEQEKNNLMEVIQGAHQQAKRIILQAQEHYDKLIKTAEHKVRNVESSLLIKQDEIISASNVQASQIIQEGKRKSAQIVFDAEQKAIEATKGIVESAESTKQKAEDFFKEKVNEAQAKADEIVKKHTALGAELLQEAREKAQELREKIVSEGESIKDKSIQDAEEIKKLAIEQAEKIKEQFLENAKNELQTNLNDLYKEKDQLSFDLKSLVNQKEKISEEITDRKNKQMHFLEQEISSAKKELELEFEKYKAELEEKKLELEKDQEEYLKQKALSLEKDLESESRGLKHEIEKLKKDRDHELKIKQDELRIVLEKHTLDLNRLNEEKEEELKCSLQDLIFSKEKIEKEIKNLSELKEIEIKQKKAEIEQLFLNHQLEVEKNIQLKERELREKMEADTVSFRRSIAELEATIQSKQIESQDLDTQKENIVEALNFESQKLKQIQSEVLSAQERKKLTEESHKTLIDQIKDFELEKEKATDVVKDLESRAAHLKMTLESDAAKVTQLQKDYELKLVEYKTKLDLEFAQLKKEKEEQFRQSFNLEAENAKMMKAHLMQEVVSKQNIIIQDIHQKVLKVFSNQLPKDSLMSLSDLTMRQIKSSFEENVASLSTQNQAAKIDTSDLQKKQNKIRAQSMTMGIVVGLFVMGGYKLWSDHIKERSLASVLEEQQKAREADLAKRKFNPTQDLEVRDNYTDSVIYTQNFSELYQDAQLQDRWVREASDYMYRQWRIPEEKTIEILSKTKTLVGTLQDKKENIHPDFVEQNIQKMKELETESVAEIKNMLGTDVKFEAFKKFEKKFFMNEMARRAPAEVYVDPNLEESK